MDGTTIILCLLHWNDTDQLSKHVQYLESFNLDILIIDNGSTASHQDRLNSLIDSSTDIKVIWNNENLGFGPALNKAFIYARDRGYNYAAYCNNDIRWIKGNIKDLLFSLHNSSMYLVYPILAEKDGYCIGGAGMATMMNTRVYEDEKDKIVDYVPGTLIALRLSLFDQIDLFCEKYFFGGELAHLSKSMEGLSLNFGLVREVVVAHDRHAGFHPQKTYYNWRNRFIYLRYFEGPIYQYVLWSTKLLGQIGLSIANRDINRARVAYYALVHGIWGKVGKYDLQEKNSPEVGQLISIN